MATILLVEDSEDFARVFRLHLEKHGFIIERARDGEEGLEKALSDKYDLVVLDVGLPKKDGFDVLREIRIKDKDLPVLMLTSKDQELDKVAGLDLGADDYVTKPFSAAELLSRINALLRRSQGKTVSSDSQEPRQLVSGSLMIDFASRRVSLNDTELELTAKEFDLIAFFASHPGEAFSRDELLEAVWGYDGGDYNKSVNTAIMRLRQKIEADPANPQIITTVRGYGYRYAKPEEL